MVLEPLHVIGFAPVMAVAVIVTITTALLSARFFEAPARRMILSLSQKHLSGDLVGAAVRKTS
jgi:peptidoglycan/LPS O-acetylase OafA/YrhL